VVCTKCQVKKGRGSFHRDATRPSGYSPWCKECRAIANRQYRQARPKAERRSFPKRVPETRIIEGVRLLNEGWSWVEAARQAGVDKHTLRARAQQADYQIRRGRSIAAPRWERPCETDLAYLAAFLDGEGHITIYGEDRLAVPKRQVVVGITNTHKPTMEWLAAMGGCKPRIKKSEGRLGTVPCYYWQMTARLDALAFLEAVVPYMRIKRTKALQAIGLLREWTEGIPVRPRVDPSLASTPLG
jgi:hypothetical protein